MTKTPHVIPIPGIRRIGYLESNVASAVVELSAHHIAWLDPLIDPAAMAGARDPEAGFASVEQG